MSDGVLPFVGGSGRRDWVQKLAMEFWGRWAGCVGLWWLWVTAESVCSAVWCVAGRGTKELRWCGRCTASPWDSTVTDLGARSCLLGGARRVKAGGGRLFRKVMKKVMEKSMLG